MTICVAVKVRDCLVFAADSTVTLDTVDSNGSPAITAYNHADKLFNLRKGLPIASMFTGIGSFGSLSISTISKDFRQRLSTEYDEYFIDPNSYTMERVAELATKYFFDECFNQLASRPEGFFSYFIGGYSSNADMGEIWSFEIDNGSCSGPDRVDGPDVESGVVWAGQPDALNRLILGYDGKIRDALVAAGVPAERMPLVIDRIAHYTRADLVNPTMPVTDAIDLAKFFAETTKQFVRFLPGSNPVGGSIDVATITKHENFKWVNRKHFYPQTLNPLETNHA